MDQLVSNRDSVEGCEKMVNTLGGEKKQKTKSTTKDVEVIGSSFGIKLPHLDSVQSMNELHD